MLINRRDDTPLQGLIVINSAAYMSKQNYQRTSATYHSTPGGRPPTKLSEREWQTPNLPLYGLLQGKDLSTDVTLIRYVTEEVGGGPTLHVHPYDEIFTIQEGRARFTVGDRVIDAEAGGIVFGPANIPHGYQNLGPGRLDSLDIHLSPEWIQYDLAEAWEENAALVSTESKVEYPDRQ